MNLETLETELLDVKAQQRALAVRSNELQQAILALRAPYKNGDTIEWGSPGDEKRGVVCGFQSWCVNNITYIVKRLRKDGSTGATVKVYPYDKPRASSSACPPDSAGAVKDG